MITIETPPIPKQNPPAPENKSTPKPELPTAINEPIFEVDIKSANRKINELQQKVWAQEKELSELKQGAPSTDMQIKCSLNADGQIHMYVLKHILKKEQIENSFTIANLYLKKIWLGDGWYQCIIKS